MKKHKKVKEILKYASGSNIVAEKQYNRKYIETGGILKLVDEIETDLEAITFIIK